MARAEAMRDAVLAFEVVDTNHDGIIDQDEAAKLVQDLSLNDNLDGNFQEKIDAFF